MSVVRPDFTVIDITMDKRAEDHKKLDKTFKQQIREQQRQRAKNRFKSHMFISLRTFIVVINFVIVLACTSTLIFQAVQCFIRYFRADTKAILNVKPTAEATFPAFTICPRFQEAYNSTALQEFGLDLDQYKDGDFYGNGAQKDANGFDIYEKVSFSLGEIMEVLEVSTSSQENSTIDIHFDKPLDPSLVSWYPAYDRTYGRCFSLQLMPKITSLSIINIVMISKMGVHVYLHHPSQYLDVDSKTKIYGTKGSRLYIDATHELTINTLEDKGEIPCNSSMDWMLDKCVADSIRDALIEEFGCVVPFVPRTEGIEVCRFNTDTEEGLAFKASVLERYEYLSSNGQSKLCPKPCSMIEVFLSLPFFGEFSENGKPLEKAYMKVYVKSTVKAKKTVLDYTALSMLAEIGGYTGLLLGISVVNVTKYLDKLFFKLFKK